MWNDWSIPSHGGFARGAQRFGVSARRASARPAPVARRRATQAIPLFLVSFIQVRNAARCSSLSRRAGVPGAMSALCIVKRAIARPSSPRGATSEIADDSAGTALPNISVRNSPARTRKRAPLKLASPRSCCPELKRSPACPSCRETTPASKPGVRRWTCYRGAGGGRDAAKASSGTATG